MARKDFDPADPSTFGASDPVADAPAAVDTTTHGDPGQWRKAQLPDSSYVLLEPGEDVPEGAVVVADSSL